jgi:hypothetical protein
MLLFRLAVLGLVEEVLELDSLVVVAEEAGIPELVVQRLGDEVPERAARGVAQCGHGGLALEP